ncbi:MAG: SpaH/EbpB family LPXTG-anchored major pilin [Cellulomonadaceae bacterium]|jgi:fimbrial isopeptide formation D2 family protein/LPXTG-motif cell wall-anchored protein|nr:SpaH/EbpB family LPXTG-anchored major pilin [Cellulomonadaceae bacterium]
MNIRKLGAAVATSAIIAALSLSAASSAVAAETVDHLPTQRDVTLTIHKYKGAVAAGVAANGTNVSSQITNPVVEGVTFKVCQVGGVNLLTQDGWNTAKGMTVAMAKSAATTDCQNVTTGETGIATFSKGNGVGLYYVEETATPAGIVAAAPFVVAIPLTDPNNLNTWMYNVHVFPKNDEVGISKDVDDTQADNHEGTVTYILTSDIPKISAGDVFRQYIVTDKLPEGLSAVNVTGVKVNGTPLDASKYTVTNVDRLLTVTLTNTATGDDVNLAAAELSAAQGGKVEITFTANSNRSGIIINGGTGTEVSLKVTTDNGTTTIPGSETKIFRGGVDLKKVGKDTSGAGLKGACFVLYASAADARANTNPVRFAGTGLATDGTTAIAGAMVGEICTDGSGMAKIDGLKYASDIDSSNGIADISDGAFSNRDFWLVETKAPAGYELQAEPIKFNVSGAIANGTMEVGDVTVVDVPTNANFGIPLTGGAGTAIFTILGACVLGGGAAFAVVRSRKQSA